MEDIRKESKKSCVLITEANERVASGHLMEMVELSLLLKKEHISFFVFVNADAPKGLKDRFACTIVEYDTDVELGREQICREIRVRGVDVIITDLREVSNKWIQFVKNETNCKLLCIDEFGRRKIDADVIINPMIDPFFWDYRQSEAILYTGHEYLILPGALSVYHDIEKEIREEIKTVCISMGGVDPHGTTVELMRVLPGRLEDIRWEVVLGAGFSYEKELADVIHGCKGEVRVHRNIDYLFRLFFEADLAFTAGGNTLHELACIGTPSIVIPSMPHEINNGKMYEKGGFCKCLSTAGMNHTENDLISMFEGVMDQSVRQMMSLAGKKMSDGQGGKRNILIIKKMINQNT